MNGSLYLCAMIVANMNLHEVYEVLKDETPKLIWKRDSLYPKAIKELRKCFEYPACVIYDYKIPSSNNQYIIYFYHQNPFADVLAGILLVLYDGNKRFVIQWTEGNKPEIHILTSHFLQRYKERFLNQPELTANEVAVRFISRNNKIRPINVNERINKHIEKYGEYANEGFLVNDGFCFKLTGEEYMEGEEQPIGISFYTTFMPLTEMSDSQLDAICEEVVQDLKDLDFSI